MSRIFFHSEHGTAELSGRERASMGRFCHAMLVTALGADVEYEMVGRPSPLRRLVPKGHYLHDISPDAENGRAFPKSLRTWLHVGHEKFNSVHDIDPFVAALNTAGVVGSDPVRLMARLHGQCEVHAYVEGPHRNWLASIIDAGRASAVFRSGQGWEAVATFLRSRHDCPVVTSYSVCEQFPNANIAGWTDDRDGDGFYDLTDAERWSRALAGLRESGGGLEMTPENWSSFFFTPNVNGFHLRDEADAADHEKPNAGIS